MTPRPWSAFLILVFVQTMALAQDAAVTAPKAGLLDSFLQPILAALALVIAGVITAGAKRLMAKWHIELTAAQEAQLRAKVRNAVLQVEQTYVSKVRKGGRLTPENAVQALGKTLEISARDLGQAGVAKLASLTGKGEDALREVVEEEVSALKLLRGAGPKA